MIIPLTPARAADLLEVRYLRDGTWVTDEVVIPEDGRFNVSELKSEVLDLFHAGTALEGEAAGDDDVAWELTGTTRLGQVVQLEAGRTVDLRELRSVSIRPMPVFGCPPGRRS